MKTYREEHLVDVLKERASFKRGLTIMGEEFGVSLAFISQVISGKKRISEKLADAMGYTKEVVFRAKKP